MSGVQLGERSQSLGERNVSIQTETDTSEHSYTLRGDGSGAARRLSSAFSRAAATGEPILRDQLTQHSPPENVWARMTRRASAPDPARSQDAGPVKISMELPADILGVKEPMRVTGRVVKRRRRIPVPLVLFFGGVSTLALMIGCTTLSIGIFNFLKIRAARAATTIDELKAEIVPMLNELVNTTRALAQKSRR